MKIIFMKKIVILHSDMAPDAGLDELDCLEQADAIASALTRLHYDPVLLPFQLNLNHNITRLQSLKPVAVFNIVETLDSKGSLIHFAPAILDMLQIPYTGCPTQAIFQTSNKPLSKKNHVPIRHCDSGLGRAGRLQLNHGFFRIVLNQIFLGTCFHRP